MALPQLTEEQIRDWSLEEKDRWWFENVYRGSTPQLTFRAAATGFLLGGILSSTNLYIGAKTGWSLGVGITSVILTFAMYRVMARIGIARDISILENNCSQSVATAAGYMTAPLVSSLTAYMLIDNRILPWHQIILWNVVTSLLGVLFAFPLKRWFINDEQQPFPEGRAAGVVLATLHESGGDTGMRQARIMLISGLMAALVKFFQAEGIQEFIQFRLLRLKNVLHEQLVKIPEQFDFGINWFGVSQRDLTIVPALDISLIGAGGLMGIRAGISLLLGAVLNYFVLVPWMIQLGEIQPKISAEGVASYGLRQITLWSLWPGVACLVAASIAGFLFQPRLIKSALGGMFRKREQASVLKDIELPMWISIIGIPLLSLASAYLAKQFFGVDMLMCLLGIPVMFALTVVAANSTAQTSITPVGATSKITQLFYGVVQQGNITTNVAAAGLTAEVVSNASNLLMDLKPGYMLGAKPRLQAIAHVIGIMSGALFSVPLFFILFTQNVKVIDGETVGIQTIQSEKFPMPSVTVWKAVAEVLTEGIESLPQSAQFAIAVGVLVGLVFELSRMITKGRFPISPVAMGLAFVIDFGSSFAMFVGSMTFWWLGRNRRRDLAEAKNWWAENQDPICAGLISGAALVGVLDAIITGFVL